MANRFGNQYRIAIGKETSFASGFTNLETVRFADLLVHTGTIEMTPNVNTVATSFRSLSPITHPCEEIADTTSGTVVIRGDLTLAHVPYFEGFFNGVTTPGGVTTYKFASNPNAAPVSFIIMQLWSDTPDGTKYTVARAIGAKLINLTISGSQGGLIQYEATFESHLVTRETAQAIVGDLPANSCPDPLHFADLTATLAMGGGATVLDSFSVKLTNTLTADTTKFQNSRVIASPLIISCGGEISYTCNYNSAGDEVDTSILNDHETINEDILKLYDSGGEDCFQITTQSIATGIAVPDVDRDIIKLNYTGKLVELTDPAITIEVVDEGE